MIVQMCGNDPKSDMIFASSHFPVYRSALSVLMYATENVLTLTIRMTTVVLAETCAMVLTAIMANGWLVSKLELHFRFQKD